MEQLDDLSICKRIAEIKGYEVSVLANNYLIKKDISFGSLLNATQTFAACKTVEAYKQAEYRYKEHLFDPLTDDALCFQLMIKYKVEFEPLIDCYSAYISTDNKGEFIDVSANKAICLAIIAAHEA